MLYNRVLVTGATGFLGRHLVPALTPSSSELFLASRHAGPQPSLIGGRVLAADLDAPGAASALVRTARPDVVFHLAGDRGRGAGGASRCARVNVAATLELLEAALAIGVRRVVLVGSAEEYGARGGPLSEDLPLAPLTPYGISKAAATQAALALASRDGCPVVVLRLFTVYGPGQPAEMFVAEAVHCAVHGEPFAMTEGRQRRDLVYVDDIVAALLAAARTPGVEGRVINVGSGAAVPLRDVAERVWRLSGTPAALRVGARPAAPEELVDTWADASRARDSLAWEPRVSLDAGLSRTIESAREKLGARCPA